MKSENKTSKNNKPQLKLYRSYCDFKAVGQISILTDSKAVHGICFEGEELHVLKRLKKYFDVSINEDTSALNKTVKNQLQEYFSGNRQKFKFKIDACGTEFQKSVWNLLMEIPYGKTISYKDLAEKLKMSHGFQAIGQASRSNPVCLAIPCHRVIARTGQMSGYIGGTGLKSYLLSLEKGEVL